jgi:hypothetical protein
MEIDDRLKKYIFKKLVKDLSNVEVIPYNGSIWFIDRDKKYWYLELERKGFLWWRGEFFEQFFQLFSLERDDYEPIIADWVEQILNQKVDTTLIGTEFLETEVEQILNRKVSTTLPTYGDVKIKMEKILKRKVNNKNPK